MNVDPIGFAGGSVNLYEYTRNNPVKWVDSLGLEPYPKWVETRLREVFAPLIKESGTGPCLSYSPESCCKLIEAAALKFIADEYITRTGLKGFFIDLLYQDFRARSGALIIPGEQKLWTAILGKKLKSWKRGNKLAQLIVRALRPAYHDLGPANIELDTALQALGMTYETASNTEIMELARMLTTNKTTSWLAFILAWKASKEFQGHFDDKCCKYERRNVQLIVNRLREGEDYWTRVWYGELYMRHVYLKTPEAFEEWKEFPDNPEFSELIKDHVAPLNPDVLDDDKFKLIEELIQ